MFRTRERKRKRKRKEERRKRKEERRRKKEERRKKKENCQSLFFVSDCPKPSFVLVRLVDEDLEEVIELLHIFCTIEFADVADQRCMCRASV